MKRYDVITILKFGDTTTSAKVGSYFETRKEGCYKLVLDYRPNDPDAPLLIIVRNDDGEDESIFSSSWLIEGATKSHSIFGLTPYGPADNVKKASRRIGSVFTTQTDHVYSIKINLWPLSNETDMLCIESSASDVLDKIQ